MKFISLLAILLLSMAVYAGNVTLYLFYSTTCPHCHAELEFLQEIAPKYPSLDIKKFAVDTSDENLTLMDRFAKAYSLQGGGVPQTYISNQVVLGYDTNNTYGKPIEEMIKNCSEAGCTDPFTIVHKYESGQPVNTTIVEIPLREFPVIGILDMNSISLPQLAEIIVLIVIAVLLIRLFIRTLRLTRDSGKKR
jgi:thiol-disulfide isomerase/thioredoxin